MLFENISCLYSFHTEYSADSIEWCPHSPHENVFVCANYELKESDVSDRPKKRIGGILLFSVIPDSGLKLHQVINTPGVLDQKWCINKVNNNTLLGVVNASKRIEIYILKDDIHLELMSFFEIENDNDILILSLDWSSSLYEYNEPKIVCSDSNGNIHLLKLMHSNLILQNSWHGHDYETWIAGFYYWDTNIFFSGGDDSIFLKFDSRVGNTPVGRNKVHTAGVTSMHSNCSKENIIVTGSYDEYIRLWDIRNIKNELNSIKMPGPLWRLKWDPFLQDYLLAACMLGGAHIVDLKNFEELKIIGSLYEHQSICYGADWSYLKSEGCKNIDPEANAIIGTCSFYDRLLCISKIF